LARLTEPERERILEDAFWYWRERGFPYDELTDQQIISEFHAVNRAMPVTPRPNEPIGAPTVGLRLANYFHPSMWRVRCRNAHSPFERFHCDLSLRRALRRALTIWPDLCSINCTNLRSMLRTFSKTTRVSNFRPAIAKSIILHFSKPGSLVLDFSAGYSGRLLGCATLDRRYIGIDPSAEQIEGGRRLISTLRRIFHIPGEQILLEGCAEDLLPQIDQESFHLIFSSPPYFSLERYSEETTQSYVRYPRYKLWRDKFLHRTITAGARLLKRRGYFVLNVANVNGYPIADDAMAFAGEELRHISTLQLQLARKPYLAERHQAGRFKHEPILVFQKR
jgi:DNA modification methylase